MNALLNMNTGILESGGIFLGQFFPSSHSNGSFKINNESYTYKIFAESYGFTIKIFHYGKEVATRISDIHEGIESVEINNFECELNDNGVFYTGQKGRIGKISFTENEITLDFSENLPKENFELAIAVGVLDVMWANLIGFTRKKPGKTSPLLSQAELNDHEHKNNKKTKKWWRFR